MVKDKRYERTEEAIMAAFKKLLTEIDFNDLTITTLILEAKINRTTFYSHYADKYALLDAFEDQQLRGLREAVGRVDLQTISSSEAKREEVIRRTVDYLAKNGRTFSVLLNEGKFPEFRVKLTDTISHIWEEHGVALGSSPKYDYLLAAETGMFSSLIRKWVENDFRESPAEITKIVARIIAWLPSALMEDRN